MRRHEIRDRLTTCAERLDMLYEATVRWQQSRIDRDVRLFGAGAPSVFDMQNASGEPILAPILAAQAHVLAALAGLDE